MITKPHCGAVVFQLSKERLTEIYDIRILMEQYCAARTCIRASDDDIRQLEEISLKMLDFSNNSKEFMQTLTASFTPGSVSSPVATTPLRSCRDSGINVIPSNPSILSGGTHQRYSVRACKDHPGTEKPRYRRHQTGDLRSSERCCRMCWTPSQFFLKTKHLPSIDSRIITKGDERSSCLSAFTAYYFFLLFLSTRQQRNLRPSPRQVPPDKPPSRIVPATVT